CDNALDLPSAEHIGNRATVGQPVPALPKREFIAIVDPAAMGLVVPGQASIQFLIRPVGGVVRFHLAGVVVDVFRELIIGPEEQTSRIALLEPGREGVEAGISVIVRSEDSWGELWIGKTRDDRRRAEIGLILVIALGQLMAAAAGIGELQQQTPAKTLLNIEIPL